MGANACYNLYCKGTTAREEPFYQGDTYVKVICANKIMKTEVVDDEPEHPKFEEATSTFTFPVVNPAGAEEVCFEVWDKDTLSPDDFIGRASDPVVTLLPPH